MKTRPMLRLLPVLSVFLLSACEVLSPPSEDPVLIKLEELDRRLQAIERVMENQSLVQLTQQVDALDLSSSQELKASVKGLVDEISAIEGRIYQVNNQSRQDPLNFPIMLNDKLAGLIRTVESAEARPTDQTRAVFANLSARVDDELRKLRSVLDEELPRVNERLEAAGLAPIERRALVVEEEVAADMSQTD